MPVPRKRYRAELATDAPLLGATVVVTRPTATAAPLKRQIVRRGGNVLSLPAIALRPAENPAGTRAALKAAHDADIVVFTSPAAVLHAFLLMPKLRFARATRVCAMGSAGATLLNRNGIRNVLTSDDRQDSEGLLALAELQKVRRRRVALIGAPGGRDLLATTLRQRGARVVDVYVYRRVAPNFNQRHFAALESAPTPLITLLSSLEALERLREALPLRLFARLADGELIASSERIAAAARTSLFANVHLATSAEAVPLVEAACNAMARHRI